MFRPIVLLMNKLGGKRKKDESIPGNIIIGICCETI